jgi:hypothetical protein
MKTSVANRVRRISSKLREATRIAGMKLILRPAAHALPRKVALLMADSLGLFLLVLPDPGRETYIETRTAFAKGRFASFRLAWRRLALPFRDFVVHERLITERESALDWRITQRHTDGIDSLRKSEESYILVSGHFTKESSLCLASPQASRNRFFLISVEDAPKGKASLHDRRVQIQLGQFNDALSSCWGRDVQILTRGGDLRSATRIYNCLREPGNVIMIAADAEWSKDLVGSYVRPFAGMKTRAFSMGAVQLARLTRRPLISCVSWLSDDGSVVLEWGDVIRIDGKDSSGEVAAMNSLLDGLELAVGERPDQYYLDIGDNRRWNPRERKWEDRTE